MSETPTPPPAPEEPGTEQQRQTWGAPPSASAPKWGWRKTAIAAAVAVGIAGVGGAAVWAAGSAAGERGDGGPGGGAGMRVMGGGPGGMGRSVLHGESVVKDENGDYLTQLTQTGEITALTDDSVTARSEDGYTRTYTIDADTVVESVEVGDQAMIVAEAEGDTATADMVVDAARLDRVGPRGGSRSGGQGGMPPGRP